MGEYIRSLPDGWTIYIWLVAAAGIILAAIYFLRWAHQNEQFDEDIKYLVFDEDDKPKMSPEDYKRSREVLKEQIAKREAAIQQMNDKRASK